MNSEIQGNSTIWFVDDDPDDQYLFQHALDTMSNPPLIRCFYDATALFDALNEHLCELPQLILLDINLPGIDGIQALTQLKQNEDLCHIPVVIYSTSQATRDIADCYRLGANSVITKRGSYTEIVETVQLICQYWFSIVTLCRN